VGVLEDAHVGDVQLVVVGREGDAEGVAPDAHAAHQRGVVVHLHDALDVSSEAGDDLVVSMTATLKLPWSTT
jgi:hypothetical protein